MAVTEKKLPTMWYSEFFGLSTDAKPTSVGMGSTFLEYDTGQKYITYDGDNWVMIRWLPLDKVIETELRAITAVLANAQSISSILDVSAKRKVTIFIDHAKDAAGAAVGQGTEYVIQISEKESGNDTWRSLAAFTAALTAPTAVATDNLEPAGSTVIECGASVPAVGNIVFFKNATLANSEWANVTARDITGGSENFTIESGLTNAQAAGTYYTQGEHMVITVDVQAVMRLRVVCNNTKGTTNQNIVWRCAAITAE